MQDNQQQLGSPTINTPLQPPLDSIPWQRVLDQIPCAALIHAGGVIQYANPAAAFLAGCADAGSLAGQCVDRVLSDTGLPTCDSRSPQSEPPSQSSYRTRLVRHDGETVAVEVTHRALDQEGPLRVCTVLRDISVEQRLEDELQHLTASVSAGLWSLQIDSEGRWREHLRSPVMESIEEARQKSEEQRQSHLEELAHAGRLSTMGQLVAAIAHEINQPLYAISNYAGACHNAMQQGTDSSREKVSNWIKEIEHQARRAGLIIAKLGDFVRKSPPQRSTHDLNKLIVDSLDLLRLEAHSHQVRLGLELASSMPSVLADRVQIEQIVVNLVRNAFDALEGVPPAERRVAVRTEHLGDRVSVHVEDCGKGLTAEEHRLLFEPFFTTKSKGTGMGLAISRSIIEAHGGRLWATDNPLAGATFHFELPAHGEDPA